MHWPLGLSAGPRVSAWSSRAVIRTAPPARASLAPTWYAPPYRTTPWHRWSPGEEIITKKTRTCHFSLRNFTPSRSSVFSRSVLKFFLSPCVNWWSCSPPAPAAISPPDHGPWMWISIQPMAQPAKREIGRVLSSLNILGILIGDDMAR